MKFIYFTFLIILLSSCGKPRTVLICGDHVCINKTEAEQYFEENLSLEVKIVDKKVKNELDLIELNLKEHPSGKKKIILSAKKSTSENLKILTNEEKSKIKKKIKFKEKNRKIVKKDINKKINDKNSKTKKKVEKIKELKKKPLKDNININSVNKSRAKVVDVCTILEKCSIEEISKFLLEQGRKKNFPDITIRQ